MKVHQAFFLGICTAHQRLEGRRRRSGAKRKNEAIAEPWK